MSSDVMNSLDNSLSIDQQQSVKDCNLSLNTDLSTFDAGSVTDICEIGQGRGGTVSKVDLTHLSRQFVATRKTFDIAELNQSAVGQIARDIHEVLSRCNSPYLPSYFNTTHTDLAISVFTEYMDAGDAESLLLDSGRLPEPILVGVAHSLLYGLDYLRTGLGLYHRNLKPSNILLSRSGAVKIADFTCCPLLCQALSSSYVSMQNYMAPEVLSGEPFEAASDLWSLGLTLVHLATGRYPIPATDSAGFVGPFRPDYNSNAGDHWQATRIGEKLRPLNSPSQRCLPSTLFQLITLIVQSPSPRLATYCFSSPFLALTHACLGKSPAQRYSFDLLLQSLLPSLVNATLSSCPWQRSSSSIPSSSDLVDSWFRNLIANYLVGLTNRSPTEDALRLLASVCGDDAGGGLVDAD